MDCLLDKLAKNALLYKDRPAIIARDRKLTYGELYAYVRKFCQYLKNKGIKKGDMVICRASATHEYWVSYFGTQLAGGVFVPLEKDISESSLTGVAEQLRSGGLFALIGGPSDRRTAQKIGLPFVCSEDVLTLAEQTRDDGDVVPPKEEDVGQIMFTTGTTGKAKGVVLVHGHFARSAYIVTDIPYGDDTVMLLPSPMNHVLSVGRCTSLLMRGGTAVIINGLIDIGKFYETLKNYGVNSMILPPSALNYIVALTGEEFAKYDKQIKFIETGGEKITEYDQKKLIELMPSVRFFNVYGSTETGELCYYEFSRFGPSEHRLGKVVDYAVLHFTDADGHECKATKDAPAFIAVEAKYQMSEYWGDARTTASVKRGDMILMSDYGYIDEEGFICLAGRAGDVIISGGLKINPTDVENAALKTGLIADCVCYGLNDKMFGKQIALTVVMNKGVEFDVTRIRSAMSEQLENYKLPQVIKEATEIRRNANGKKDRRSYADGR